MYLLIGLLYIPKANNPGNKLKSESIKELQEEAEWENMIILF
jgi:hypothetical protein